MTLFPLFKPYFLRLSAVLITLLNWPLVLISYFYIKSRPSDSAFQNPHHKTSLGPSQLYSRLLKLHSFLGPSLLCPWSWLLSFTFSPLSWALQILLIFQGSWSSSSLKKPSMIIQVLTELLFWVLKVFLKPVRIAPGFHFFVYPSPVTERKLLLITSAVLYLVIVSDEEHISYIILIWIYHIGIIICQ